MDCCQTNRYAKKIMNAYEALFYRALERVQQLPNIFYARSLWLTPIYNMNNHIAVNLGIEDCLAQSRKPTWYSSAGLPRMVCHIIWV
jgi:hypothetical protein